MHIVKVFSSYDENELNSSIEEFIKEKEANAKELGLKFNIAKTDTIVAPDGLIIVTLSCDHKRY